MYWILHTINEYRLCSSLTHINKQTNKDRTMGFSYYCSQTAEIFLLVLWNNRPLQQSGNSGDIQLRNRSLFCSGSDPARGVWWPETGCLRGQNQGTTMRAVHWLFGRGGASWSKKIFCERVKKKKAPLGLLFHICLPPRHCTRSPSEGGWGQYTNSCGVNEEGGD